MTLNSYLLAQAAVATIAAAPPGISLGEWLAGITLFLVASGVVYKAGVASQKAQNVEDLVGGVLQKLSDQVEQLITETQDARVEDARWKTEIASRVAVLEGKPIHIHQRASDR